MEKEQEPANQNTTLQNQFQQEYCHRLHKVVDYINEHLHEELSLEKLANEANFSKFHFHRIFTAFTGETLGSYIQRLRLEWAAGKLITSPSYPITEVCFDAGYSNPSVFSKAFNDRFGVSPTAWRKSHLKSQWLESGRKALNSNICTVDSKDDQVHRNEGTAMKFSFRYSDYTNLFWRITMEHYKTVDFTVKVENSEELEVAYVRHTGPYAGDGDLFNRLFEKLFQWAGPRGFLAQPGVKVLTIYHDSPEITEEDKLRISICVTVPKGTPAEGEIGRMTIPAGLYAIGSFEIDMDQYEDAWNGMMNAWLPKSGFQCSDHGLCYELNKNDPSEHPEHKHIVDIYIPVKPL